MRNLSRFPLTAAVAACLLVLAPAWAQAKVHIAVDLDAQTMRVEAGGKVFNWRVSSGKPGYETPAGNFKVLWMDKDHHSDTYEGAYMPNAIFFAPGYAIHGFGKSPWGHKASHGCIRIPVAKSAILFEMVKAQGADVIITGDSPTVAPTVESVEAARNPQQIMKEPYPATPDGQGYEEPPPPPPAAAPAGSPLLGGFY